VERLPLRASISLKRRFAASGHSLRSMRSKPNSSMITRSKRDHVRMQRGKLWSPATPQLLQQLGAGGVTHAIPASHRRFPSILDIWHVTEYLYDLAHCFYRDGSKEGKAFVETYLRKLLEGKVNHVIGGIRQMATKRNLPPSKWNKVEGCLTYSRRGRNT